MTDFIGLDIAQKMTAIYVVDNDGYSLWRGRRATVPTRSPPHCADMRGMRAGISSGWR